MFEKHFSLLSSLISKRDIFTILTEYLTIKEIVGLDNVFCSKEFRDDFLDSIQSITISLPESTALIKGWVKWCCRHQIFKSRGMLPLYGWNWTDLLQGNLSNGYRSFLTRVKYLSLLGDLDYHHLHRCPPFSALETLSLESSRLDNSVMQYFLRSTRLHNLHLIAPIKFDTKILSTELFSDFFGRITKVYVNCANDFLQWINCTSLRNKLEDVHLTDIRYINHPLKYHSFFQQSPCIQNLTLTAVKIECLSFFNLLKDVQTLNCLHLDSCIFHFNENNHNSNDHKLLTNIQLKCKKLEIRQPYSQVEDGYCFSILQFFTKELTYLSFIDCNDFRLNSDECQRIQQIFPNLLSFQITNEKSLKSS